MDKKVFKTSAMNEFIVKNNILKKLRELQEAQAREFVSDVEAEQASELFDELDTELMIRNKFIAKDENGTIRMIMSGESLEELLGVAGYLVGLKNDGTTVTFYVDADTGALMAAEGVFKVDENGVYLEAYDGSGGYNTPNAFKFTNPTGGGVLSYFQHILNGGYSTLLGIVNDLAATISTIYFNAISPTESHATLMASSGGGVEGYFSVYQAAGATLAIVNADEIDFRGTVLQQGAASGFASLDASSRVVEAIQRVVSGTAALTATEGYAEWQSTTKRLLLYDAQRERSLSSVGWVSNALPLIYDPGAALTTAYSLAANGGTLAIPILVTGHMLLQGVTVRNTDTASVRSWRWHLYEQYSNNGDSAENTLTRIESGNGNDTFTPTVASNRTLNGTSAPVYLAPGVYWLAIQNTHATNTFGLGSTAAGSAFAPNSGQSKTLTVPLGSTLDLVAATWTKVSDIYGVRLNGRVFGQTTAF